MKSIKKYFFVTIIIFAIASFSNSTNAQNDSDSKKPEPQIQRIAGLNARFIVALIDDGLGGVWIGTEDEGVFHCDSNNKISQFTTKNGLGDNNGYALAIDKLGRLWVGHLNTGVSVFNGKDWKNYDVVDGPIGERIFDIKICPKDGDVWIATSAGISRYKIDSDNWEHFTREDGLLEDQASALAFKNDGTLIVGTQCHGLAIFNRTFKGDYKHSKNIVAPDSFGPNNCSPVPLTPRGIGLPSNLINDILVSKNLETETIWIATNAGLVKVNSDFKKIEYWRGKDYDDKVKGLYGGVPKDWKPVPNEVINQLLPEDYLTCLAEDDQGVIWMGTRQSGFKVADPQTGKQTSGDPKKMGLPDNFITKILMFSEGDYWVGFYGSGIIKPTKPYKLVDRKPLKTRFNKQKIFSVAQNNFTKLPSVIKPLPVEKLQELRANIKKMKVLLPESYTTYSGEDWKTQGNWHGRIGKQYAVLCAMHAPFDNECTFGGKIFLADKFIGVNHRKNDTIRHWVHTLQTNDKRSLYHPSLGYRRQAEWDDHGETYSQTMDGPDLWILIEINTNGVFDVDLYFFNKDGHDGANRFRDYHLKVFQSPIKWQYVQPPPENSKETRYQRMLNLYEGNARKAAEIERTGKVLATSRVRNFEGGVHKKFTVAGAGNYLFKIERNYSLNTIISMVAIDRLYGEKNEVEKRGIPDLEGIPYSAPKMPNKFSTNIGTAAGELWFELDDIYDKTGSVAVQYEYRLHAYQAAYRLNENNNNKYPRLPQCMAWRLNLWDQKQLDEWSKAMQEGHKKLLETEIGLKEILERHKKSTPTKIPFPK